MGVGRGREVKRKKDSEKAERKARIVFVKSEFPARILSEFRPSHLFSSLHFSPSLLFPLLYFIFFQKEAFGNYLPFNMSIWREACLQLRHAVAKPATGNRLNLPQSKKCLYHSAPSARVANRTGLRPFTRKDVGAWRGQQSWQVLKPTQRSFSVTAEARHGHVTPPKPGEE